MRFTGRSALGLAFAFVVLAGCASAPRERASRADASTERVCVDRREINSLGALENDRHAFINASADRYFLLSLERGCQSIRFAQGIAIADNARRLCGDGFSFLSFVHPEFGVTRCRVEWIDSVENKQEARELIEARESEGREGNRP